MFSRLSTSLLSTMRLVRQRMWEFSPFIPFMVTCTLFLSQGASTYTSSMWGSERSTSKMPAPTECLYAMEHMSPTTSSRPSGPQTRRISSYLSVSRDLAIPVTLSLSSGPPSSRYLSRIPSMTSMTTALRASG